TSSFDNIAGTASAGPIPVNVIFLEGTAPAEPDTSFPTRRSSDLFFKFVAYPLGTFGFIVLTFFVIVGTSNAVNLTDGLDGHEERSEEHTSELQSRRDIVCRLLLEKKERHATASDRNG